MNEVILKFIRFGIVGFIGLIIDFGVTYLLKEKIKINKFVANSIGFSLAVINNYLLNKYWTFNSTNSNIISEFSSFLLVCVIGLLLNNAILYYLTERTKLSFYIAKAGSVLIVMLWNFSANYFFTFRF